MKNASLHKYRKYVGRLCWVVIIVITIIWLISQQITINKYEAEIAELERSRDVLKDKNEELETRSDELTDEEYEREARKQGYVRPDEVILREAE